MQKRGLMFFIVLLNFRKCIINTFSIDYHLWKASPKAANIHNRW